MAYTITIGGIDRTADVLNKSITIEDAINDKQNICKFQLMDLSGNGIPDIEDEITVVLDDDTKIFGGYVTSIEMSKKTTGAVVASLSCNDYARLLDRNLVRKTYEDYTDKEIIEDMVTTYCPGFGITTTNVIEGVTISQISFNYIQISQALRQICDLTGRNWYIDYDKDIHYFPLETSRGPFDIAGATYMVNEDMETDPGWTLGGDAGQAEYVSGYMRMNQASGDKQGQAYTSLGGLPDDYTINAEMWTGGGTGADSSFIFWGCSSTLGMENAARGGYCVALNEYYDELRLYFNGTLLDSVAQTNIDNSTIHTVQIVVIGTNIKVYFDDTLKIDYDDTTRTLPGYYFGVGARNGSMTNEHRCYGINLTYVTDPIYHDFKIAKDASQVKNRVYVRGGTYLSDPTTYSTKGDGVKTKFTLPDKPHDVSITVNGSAKTLGIKNVHTTGYDWYLNFEEKYLEQDSGGSVLSTSDTLAVTYSYDIPVLVAVEDTTSISEIGQHEFAIFDTSIKTTAQARDRATAELTDYGNSIIEASFRTYEDGFTSGNTITVDLSEYGISNEDYIVQRVTAYSLGGGKFEYLVELASSKTMGIIRFLIELLETNRNLISLNDDEVVDELLELTDSISGGTILDSLVIDSAGQYATWCSDSTDTSPVTRARWDLFQWG